MQNRNLQPVNKKWTWRKPKGKPKRPLSAYNIFFADVRQDLLTARTNDNGIGFQNLAQAVAKKWKDLDPILKVPYIEKAKIAMERYKVELSMWESTQTNLKKRSSTLVPDDEVATLKSKMPFPENPINSKKIGNVGSSEILASFSASRCLPFAYTSGNDTNIAPTHFDCNRHDRTNESIHPQTLVDEYHMTSKRLAIPADQSAFHHYTAKACITPTLHCRRLCSSNDARSNVFHEDDTYEPLPLSSSMDPIYDRFNRLVEGSNVSSYQNFELFPSTIGDIYQPATIGENNSEMSSNERMNNCFTATQDPIQNQSNNDDPNNSTWNATQLEKLLRTLENEDWNRFL
jgi:HMG (high mobility group) box